VDLFIFLVLSILSIDEQTVIAESSEKNTGWDRIKSALEEIHACNEDYSTFLSREFDELDSLCQSLISSEKAADNAAKERPESAPAATIPGAAEKLAAMQQEFQALRGELARHGDLLSEQKSMSDARQCQWADELRQMRTMLENMFRQTAEGKRRAEPPAAAKPQSTVAAAASGDPVLESILAQFEVLQQDRLFRRPDNAEQK
jgi:hypothetical protein